MNDISEIEELKRFKERTGWSYQKISNLMGIHSQTIFYWISGKYQPLKDSRRAIRAFLKNYTY